MHQPRGLSGFQRRSGRISPCHRQAANAQGARRFDVPDFVADGRRQLCRRRASFDDGVDLGGFAEQWRAGTELVDHRRHLGAEHAANIGLGVGADDRYRNAAALERGKNIRDPGEYADLLDITCRDLAQLPDDERQFPGGNAEIGEDFSAGTTAELFRAVRPRLREIHCAAQVRSTRRRTTRRCRRWCRRNRKWRGCGFPCRTRPLAQVLDGSLEWASEVSTRKRNGCARCAMSGHAVFRL